MTQLNIVETASECSESVEMINKTRFGIRFIVDLSHLTKGVFNSDVRIVGNHNWEHYLS